MHIKIPNYKHQNTNKSQIPIFNDPNIWNFGHCFLFDICYLVLVISYFHYAIPLKRKHWLTSVPLEETISRCMKKGKPTNWFTLYHTLVLFGVDARKKFYQKPGTINGAQRDLFAPPPVQGPLSHGRHRYLL